MSKILSFDDLAERVAALRAAGKTVVQCHGVFDLLHIGHIRYLQRASELADVLLVTVTPDEFVNKGPHRPVFGQELRVDAVAALGCVDFVAVNQWATAVEAIQKLRPSYFAKGAEFRDGKTPELLREEAAIADAGGEMTFIDEFTSSSSQLINNFVSPFGEATRQYLDEFRVTTSETKIQSTLAGLAKIRPLVVGEAIIDEQLACSAIGRSAKAPVVATQFRSKSRFVGGAAAVANNLAAFCQHVQLVTLVGDDGEEEWIRDRLRPNVEMNAVVKAEAPTVRERRYRERYFDTPLFEVNYFDDRPLSSVEQGQLAAILQDCETHDLLVAADSGHTMLEGAVLEQLGARAGLMAVKTQANSANFGRNSVSKYARADLVCLGHNELELECRRSGTLQSMLSEVANKLQAKRAIVTLGKNGCAGLDFPAPTEAPAQQTEQTMGALDEKNQAQVTAVQRAEGLALNVVDRTGGGDAFFALAALATAANTPLDLTMFLANVAGAEAVSLVGGTRHLDPIALERHALSLIK